MSGGKNLTQQSASKAAEVAVGAGDLTPRFK